MSDGNGAGATDLQGPLARMWRDVYKKAGEVAEARAQELLKYHVYVYGHTAQGGAGAETGPFVNESGDRMTGTLQFSGVDTVAGGAVRVFGSGAVAEARVYGAGNPAYAPGDTLTGGANDYGILFRPAVAMYLVGVRWYRTDAAPNPDAVRLWDSTAPGAPIWSAGALTEWNDAALGWHEHRFAAGTEIALVAARTYALTFHMPFDAAGGGRDQWFGAQHFYPVPDGGLAFVRNGQAAAGTFPNDAGVDCYTGIDGAFRTSIGPGDPAQSGAIRLPYGSEGAIAWRRTDGSGDHTLTVNGSDQLVFDGLPLGGGGGNTTMYTQTTSPTGATNSLWFNPSESA